MKTRPESHFLMRSEGRPKWACRRPPAKGRDTARRWRRQWGLTACILQDPTACVFRAQSIAAGVYLIIIPLF